MECKTFQGATWKRMTEYARVLGEKITALESSMTD